MLDIKFVRENPEIVKENIKKKFQDQKLPLVDQVLALDEENHAAMTEANQLRAARNAKSKQVGVLMGQAKKDPSKLQEAEALKAEVKADADRLAYLEGRETELAEQIRHIMLQIPNIIDPSVPIGPDDSCNVEVQRFGEPVTPDFEIPYHTQIMESFDGIDMDAAGRLAQRRAADLLCPDGGAVPLVMREPQPQKRKKAASSSGSAPPAARASAPPMSSASEGPA